MTALVPTPPMVSRLSHALQRARQARLSDSRGRVVQVIGLVIESEGPLAAVGEVCRIESARHEKGKRVVA